MSAPVVVVQRGDGKLHPPGGRLPEAVRAEAIALVHTLRCTGGYSLREIVTALAGEGIRVSRGSVHAWIRRYPCAVERDG
jgi:hypothetical protein